MPRPHAIVVRRGEVFEVWEDCVYPSCEEYHVRLASTLSREDAHRLAKSASADRAVLDRKASAS